MREWLKGLRVLQNTFFIWIFFRLFLTDELYKILGLGLEQKEVVLNVIYLNYQIYFVIHYN